MSCQDGYATPVRFDPLCPSYAGHWAVPQALAHPPIAFKEAMEIREQHRGAGHSSDFVHGGPAVGGRARYDTTVWWCEPCRVVVRYDVYAPRRARQREEEIHV